MKRTNAYLIFDGNCREAMTFYERCFGGELQLMPSFAAPGDVPKEGSDRIMHASLTKGDAILLAMDTRPGLPFQQGNNFSLSIDCESIPEIDRLFAALGDQGTVKMPIQETFWAARFGMLTDRFGINWMLNVEKPR